MKKKLYLLYLLCFCLLKAWSQDGYPEIGKPMPDFILEDIQDYPQSRVSLGDLNGKPVILDFWHRYCSTCLAAFPKMNALARKYKDQLEIFTVGLEDRQGLAPLYAQLRSRHDIRVPAVFDSTLYKRMVPGLAAPHYIWIDSNGSVAAITGILDVNEGNIAAFLEGEPFDFADQSYRAYIRRDAYDPHMPFMVDGNGWDGVDMLYRSLLVPFKPNEMPFKGFPSSYSQVERLYEVYGKRAEGVAGLVSLYKFAYLGHLSWTNRSPEYREIYREPDIELDDPGELTGDYVSGENVYWYSLILPESMLSEENVRRAIRSDLEVNFGYDVTVEMREQPYWEVTATEDILAGLQSRGGERYRGTDGDISRITFVNYPFEGFINSVFAKIYPSLPPVINGTGFDGNIDVVFEDALLTDFEMIRAALGKIGIRLGKRTRPFRTLVIKASKKD